MKLKKRKDDWVLEMLREQREKKLLYDLLKKEHLPIPQFLKDEIERQPTGFGARS